MKPEQIAQGICADKSESMGIEATREHCLCEEDCVEGYIVAMGGRVNESALR